MRKFKTLIFLFTIIQTLPVMEPVKIQASQMSLEARKKYQSRYEKRHRNRNRKLSKLEVKIKEAHQKRHERKKR